MKFKLECVTPKTSSPKRQYCHTDCGPADRDDFEVVSNPSDKKQDSPSKSN